MNNINKYEIRFWNRFACQEQRFYVIANNKYIARHMFLKVYDKNVYGLPMEDIKVYEYYEPYFYTTEDIEKHGENLKYGIRHAESHV